MPLTMSSSFVIFVNTRMRKIINFYVFPQKELTKRINIASSLGNCHYGNQIFTMNNYNKVKFMLLNTAAFLPNIFSRYCGCLF